MSQATILVVDDEASIVRLITYNLEREGYMVFSAADGLEAERILAKTSIDLIILDLMLPGKNGLDLCKDLRKKGNQVAVIMLTAKGDEIDKIIGLELGADDYMTKPFSIRELMARVKVILRRRQRTEAMIVENTKTFGEFIIKEDEYQIWFRDKQMELTLKEYELLSILLRNRNKVLRREYLLQALWDYVDGVSTRVLDVHISKLREKIEDDNKNPIYIKTVRGLGYRFDDNDKNL